MALVFFGLLLHWSQPSGEPFSFTCKVVSPMVGCSLFSTLSPVLSMHGVAVYSANMAKLPRSKASLHSRAARERGRTFFRGVANNTPYYGCCTLSGLPSESKARSFSQKLNVVHASLREWGLLSASATWSIRPLGKSTASYIFVYIYIAVLAYYCIVVYQYCHITLYIYCLQ